MTSSYASLFILATNPPVMTLGGYQGWDRILTPTQLAAAVADGSVRYFLVGTGPSFGASQAGTGGANVNSDLEQWVRDSCTAVPASTYQTGNGSGSPGQLYDCAGR